MTPANEASPHRDGRRILADIQTHKGQDVDDIIIIGAGPTGLFGAFYAGLRDMKTKVMEALPEPGGQLTVLYPEKFIYDAPGHPKILAKDLVKELREQASMFPYELCLDERVEMIEPEPVEGSNGVLHKLTTTRGVHYARTVLIAAGIGAFHPNRLDRPGVAEFEDRGVHYHVRDKRAFRHKKLLIVGGGDSAVDWALNLKDWADEITLVHRRDQFRAVEGSVSELLASPVKVKLWHEVEAVHGDGTIRGATIRNTQTGETEDLDLDAVLIFIGFKADIGPIKNWRLKMDKRSLLVDGRMQSSIPGIYAAGDIANDEHSVQLNLIATGYAQAAVGVNCAKNYINPKARVFPGHSSEMKLG